MHPTPPPVPLTEGDKGGGDGFALLHPSYMTLVILQAHKVNLKSPIPGMDSLVCKKMWILCLVKLLINFTSKDSIRFFWKLSGNMLLCVNMPR